MNFSNNFQSILLSLLLVFLIFFSCKKDETFKYGEATAQKDNVSWNAGARAANNLPHGQGVDFMFSMYNNEGILREELLFRKVPIELSRIPLVVTSTHDIDDKTGAKLFKLISDGDVLSDRYNIVEDADNSFIEITSINDEQTYFEGIFEATFEIDTSRGILDANNPEIIIFKSGSFTAEIPN